MMRSRGLVCSRFGVFLKLLKCASSSSSFSWMTQSEPRSFGICVRRRRTLKDFTLGSLWTLLNNRALTWLRTVVDRCVRCENDPICYEHSPRSCERCSYLTFGCRMFNDDLDRRVLYDYLLGRGVLGSRIVPESA